MTVEKGMAGVPRGAQGMGQVLGGQEGERGGNQKG